MVSERAVFWRRNSADWLLKGTMASTSTRLLSSSCATDCSPWLSRSQSSHGNTVARRTAYYGACVPTPRSVLSPSFPPTTFSRVRASITHYPESLCEWAWARGRCGSVALTLTCGPRSLSTTTSLAKTTKMVPVIVMGRLVYNKRPTVRECVAAVVITAGCVAYISTSAGGPSPLEDDDAFFDAILGKFFLVA